jgi:hypothetical protein
MPTGSAIFSFIDQPNIGRPGRVLKLLPWRRPALWAPFVDAVYAVREFFLDGVDQDPTLGVAQNSGAKEPMKMPVAKAKVLLPEAEAAPSSARLEAAVRKAASAKAKARDAKAALRKPRRASTRPQGRQSGAEARGGVAGRNHQGRGKGDRRRKKSAGDPARAQDGSFKSCRDRDAASAGSSPAGAKDTPGRFIDPPRRGCRLHGSLATPTDTVDGLPSATSS